MNIRKIGMTAYEGGLTKLTIAVDGDRSAIAELVRKAKEKPYKLEIKKVTHRRSLDANSYYWVLLDKLSSVLGVPKTELHSTMITDYGAIKLREDGKPVIFSLRSDIDPKLVPCYSYPVGDGEVNKVKYTHYVVFKGSHEMNSDEFNNLLRGLIEECRIQGIETATPEELKKIMEVTNASYDTYSAKNEEEFTADLQEQIEWSSLDRAECITEEVRN